MRELTNSNNLESVVVMIPMFLSLITNFLYVHSMALYLKYYGFTHVWIIKEYNVEVRLAIIWLTIKL